MAKKQAKVSLSGGKSVAGGSDAGRGRVATIQKNSKPKSGPPVRTHPLNKGFPTDYRRGSTPVSMPNPNKYTRDRIDALASVAHAHTAVTAPVKAFPINARPGDKGGKKMGGKVVSPTKRGY